MYVVSIFDLNYDLLKEKGIVGLLLDLDNTIVARNESQTSEELSRLTIELKKQGFKICLLSNNWGSRVKKIAGNMGVPVISRALKPMSWSYKLAMSKIGTKPSETAVIGDQLFTDILGGNRLGIYTILVKPVSGVDLPHTKLLRKLENFVIKQLSDYGWLTLPGG